MGRGIFQAILFLIFQRRPTTSQTSVATRQHQHQQPQHRHNSSSETTRWSTSASLAPCFFAVSLEPTWSCIGFLIPTIRLRRWRYGTGGARFVCFFLDARCRRLSRFAATTRSRSRRSRLRFKHLLLSDRAHRFACSPYVPATFARRRRPRSVVRPWREIFLKASLGVVRCTGTAGEHRRRCQEFR
jgi:hypothetical protein